MGSIMQGKVSMVVLLGSTFGVNLEEELFNFQGTLLPCGKVQRKVSVVVGQGGSFRVGFKKGLCVAIVI